MNEELKQDLEDAINRINDMLQNDDGQAFKEARKWVEQMREKYGGKLSAAPAAQPMTEQEILDAFESSPDVDDDDAPLFVFQAGVRYAEKRLDIKEQS